MRISPTAWHHIVPKREKRTAMIIKNASVFTENNCFEEKDIYIEGSRIQAVLHRGKEPEEIWKAENPKEPEIVDAAGCYAIPGLVDIHFHGCNGSDLCDHSVEALAQMASYEAAAGVTAMVPAAMTVEKEQLFQICEAAAEFAELQKEGKLGGARLCGLNLEGPFISEKRKGAQNPTNILPPQQELFDELQRRSRGLIKMVDLAPEKEGAMEFIAGNKGRVKLSLAHTDADYDTAMRAFKMGADHVTHLYNAMPPYHHRFPGVIGAAADCGAEAELICDGIHVHPAVVRNTLKLFGEDKVIFISDSMRAAGLSDGCYTLGGQEVEVRGRLALLKDGTIAGSVTNLMEGMLKAVLKMQIPLEAAVLCASVNPAKSVGIFDDYGSLTPGKSADVVLLEKEGLQVRKVILRGERLKN